MRSLIAAVFVLVLSGQSIAQSINEWRERGRQTGKLLFDCFTKQAVHALEAGATEETYLQLLGVMCKEHMQLFLVAVYKTLLSTGRSDSLEAQAIAKEMLQENISKMALAYADIRRKSQKQ